MARMMECDKCLHVQIVGVITNGLPAGFPDPNKECENPECDSVGHFSAPGSHKQMQEQIENTVRVVPDPNLPRVDQQLRELQAKVNS